MGSFSSRTTPVVPDAPESEKARYSRLQLPKRMQELGNIRLVNLPEFLGVGESTCDRLIAQPDFPTSIRIGPRMRVWRICDVIAWRDAQPDAQPRPAPSPRASSKLPQRKKAAV